MWMTKLKGRDSKQFWFDDAMSRQEPFKPSFVCKMRQILSHLRVNDPWFFN